MTATTNKLPDDFFTVPVRFAREGTMTWFWFRCACVGLLNIPSGMGYLSEKPFCPGIAQRSKVYQQRLVAAHELTNRHDFDVGLGLLASPATNWSANFCLAARTTELYRTLNSEELYLTCAAASSNFTTNPVSHLLYGLLFLCP
jgi:hypothetical protein